MDNFNGYYMKCNGCDFRSPAFAREGFKFAPRLVQTTDSGVTGSGKLVMKVLPHTRSKIWCSFPPMYPEQFRVYWEALKGEEAGEGMYLEVEAFHEGTNQYITDTYYHTDLQYRPVIYNGKRMVKIEDFQLIGH